MKKIVLLLGVAVILAGCSGPKVQVPAREIGPDKLIEGPDKPDWVDNPQKAATAEFFAFAGESDPVATGSMSKDDAADKARLRALEEVWGTYMERAFKNIRARAPQMKLDSTGLEMIQDESFARVTQESGKAKGIIKGEIGEYVVQRWQRKEPNGQIKYFYRGYALLKIKRTLVQDLMAEAMADAAQDARINRGKKEIDAAVDAVKKFDSADLFKETE